MKFLTVVSDLESGEPLWVGLERKQETLDQFFAEALPPPRCRAVSTASGLPPVGPASENGCYVLLAPTPRGPHAPSTSSRPVHADYAPSR
jgi:hypothetical protein